MSRKIEDNMISAINRGVEWHCDNTRVHHDPVIDGVEVEVYLHNHLIAKRYKGGGWAFTLAGWNTRTTRSRVNALINCYVTPRAGVYTRRGQAMITTSTGVVRPIDADEWF